MDPAGADALRIRIEQHQQWRAADAVRDGSQPALDPHQKFLLSIGDEVRFYADERGAFEKRLTNGAWTICRAGEPAAA